MLVQLGDIGVVPSGPGKNTRRRKGPVARPVVGRRPIRFEHSDGAPKFRPIRAQARESAPALGFSFTGCLGGLVLSSLCVGQLLIPRLVLRDYLLWLRGYLSHLGKALKASVFYSSLTG